mmetsp:Transcript_28979/g.90205  ORF Transcript_28979/g.90205 Transcript_28979/m.90205 type:complete len:393 (-) Transcript_28979:5-1183(-)
MPLRVRSASGQDTITGLPQPPLPALHPVPPHHGVLRLVEEVERRGRLRAARLHGRAAQQVAHDAHKAPQCLRVRQRCIKSGAAPLRLATHNHAVGPPAELPDLVPDDAVQRPLDGTEGVPIDGVLAPAVIVGEVVVPREELRQTPARGLACGAVEAPGAARLGRSTRRASAAPLPPAIVAAHLPAGGCGHDDLDGDAAVHEVVWSVRVVAKGGAAEAVKVDERPLLRPRGRAEDDGGEEVRRPPDDADALAAVARLVGARAASHSDELAGESAAWISAPPLLHARGDGLPPHGPSQLQGVRREEGQAVAAAVDVPEDLFLSRPLRSPQTPASVADEVVDPPGARFRGILEAETQPLLQARQLRCQREVPAKLSIRRPAPPGGRVPQPAQEGP